jgi:translocation and assembly module TamB|tara:strand:- start:9003 stop:12749 length:3747 start_codon:yes stop_codon:yes gene_type:complete
MTEMKKSRLLKSTSLTITVLLALILLMLSWLYSSESGLQWLTARLLPYQPAGLTIGKVTGTLESGIYLTDLTWQQDQQEIQATGLDVNCQWWHLIDGLISCESLALSSLTVSSSEDTSNQSQDIPWPELNTIALPIAAKVKKVTINDVRYNKRSPQAPINYHVRKLSAKKVALLRSKVSVASLALTYEGHELKASGSVDMRKRWQHVLDFSVLGPQLSIQAKSKGSINKGAQLTLQLASPNQATLTTGWFLQQGLFLEHGLLIAPEQAVNLGKTSVFLQQAKATFALAWPTLTSTIQAQAKWQAFENIQVDIGTELANILDWQMNTQSTMQLKSELNEQALSATLPPDIAHSAPDNAPVWPVKANLDMAINQGAFTLNSRELKIGELTAAVQAEFDVNQPTAESFLVKGQINGDNLTLSDSVKFLGVDVNWLIKKQQAQWQITSNGNIAELALSGVSGKKLHWALDFSDQWQAEFKADSLNIHDIDVASAAVTLTGLPSQHQAVVKANIVDNTAINLTFDGQLRSPNKEAFTVSRDFMSAIWQIDQLALSAKTQQQNLSLLAEQLQLSQAQQTIKNLCLTGHGSLCVNGENKHDQWQANLVFNQWSILPALNNINAWLPRYSAQFPQQVSGTITGKLSALGQADKLQNVSANLSIPRLKWQTSDIQLQGENVTLNSEQHEQDFALKTQWQSIHTSLQLPEFTSEIVMPSGDVTFSYHADGKLGFKLQQPDTIIDIATEESAGVAKNSQRLLAIPLVALTGQWQQDKISTDLSILLPVEDKITAKLTSAWPLADNAKISGDLWLNLQQFDWLKNWQKRIDKIDMSLVQDFSLAGTWQQPLFEGKGALDIEHLAIDEYGLDIRNSKIKLTSAQDHIELLGKLQNPQGELSITGQAKLSAPIKADLTIEGQQVTLVNSNDNKLIVSPTLQANYQQQQLKIDGHVLVDQADIKIASLPKSAVSVSQDQVIVGEKHVQSKDTGLDYNVALTITAGDNVKISGFGLSSEIQGNITSSVISGQPLSLNGRLELKNGEFQAYKQILTIEQGQLLFLGAPENPSIQFRAVRVVDDIKVGIIADGTIQYPRLTLFSEPAMADENVLSLLITGRNLDSLTKQEGNALTSAAISLGVDSANKLVQKIGEQLGLKDVAFTSKNGTNGNSTRVDIAAKINERLNVGYGTSIDSDNSIQAGWVIEYKLSPNISFEATSGEEISANINYKKQYSPSKSKNKDSDDNSDKTTDDQSDKLEDKQKP